MDIVVDRTAKELNVSKRKVNTVQKLIFKSTADIFKMGGYDHILLQGFGKFIVKPGRIYNIEKNKEQRAKRISSRKDLHESPEETALESVEG